MLQPTSSKNKSIILQVYSTPKECNIDTISDNLYQIYIQISPNALIMSICSCVCFNSRSKQKSCIAFSFCVFLILNSFPMLLFFLSLVFHNWHFWKVQASFIEWPTIWMCLVVVFTIQLRVNIFVKCSAQVMLCSIATLSWRMNESLTFSMCLEVHKLFLQRML